MSARIAALYRHPVKGFTPEGVGNATLAPGEPFPGDRLYAVENGPSGFDPDAPAFISKQRFAVLAAAPQLARVRTRFDDATRRLHVRAEGFEPLEVALDDALDRAAFAAWLTAFIPAEDRRGALQVLDGRGWRFLDDVRGAVSLINRDSLEALSARIGRPIDPLRFRGNVLAAGWGAWAELDLRPGDRLRLGPATLEVVKAIVRCVATHADPMTGERDLDMVQALRDHHGAPTCGLYLKVVEGGDIRPGDRLSPVDAEPGRG